MKSKQFKELLQKLAKDEVIRSGINELKSSANSNTAYDAKSVADFLTHVLRISATFMGKKKAKAFIEIVEVIGFLISLSILVKKNLFDKPEVRQFFAERWSSLKAQTSALLLLASDYVSGLIARVRKRPDKNSSDSFKD